MSNQVWATLDTRYVDPILDAQLTLLEDRYEEQILQTTFSNNGEASPQLDVLFVRNGRQVIVSMTNSNAVLAGTPGSFYESDLPIPVDLQPSTLQHCIIRTRDASFESGRVEIGATLKIYRDVNSAITYTNGTPRGWPAITFNYMLN